MKKLIYGGLFLFVIGVSLSSCEKNQIASPNNLDVVNSDMPETATKRNLVVYANYGCTLPNDEMGCECIITQSDDDCSLQTECTSQSVLPNYNFVLHTKYSDEEIRYRAKNKVRITDPELIFALKLDGYPVK